MVAVGMEKIPVLYRSLDHVVGSWINMDIWRNDYVISPGLANRTATMQVRGGENDGVKDKCVAQAAGSKVLRGVNLSGRGTKAGLSMNIVGCSRYCCFDDP